MHKLSKTHVIIALKFLQIPTNNLIWTNIVCGALKYWLNNTITLFLTPINQLIGRLKFSLMQLTDTIKVLKAPTNRAITLKKTTLRGGEGILYKVNGTNNFVAKIFLKPEIAQKKQHKIGALIDLFKSLNGDAYWQDQFNKSLAMPRARLYDPNNQVFVGFLMNYFDKSQAMRLDYFIEDKYREVNKLKDKRVKFHVAANITRLVMNLHQLDILIGDLNDKNIFIRKNGNPILLDCDSVQYKNYRLDAIQPSIQPPEIYSKQYGVFPKQTDSFVLAIAVYKILMRGFHPFQYISNRTEDVHSIIKKGETPLRNPQLKLPKGSPDLSFLGDKVKRVLEACLDPNPNNRPLPSKLLCALESKIKLDNL